MLHGIGRLLAVMAVLLVVTSQAVSASAAAPRKSATVTLDFVRSADLHCYAHVTATWSGYQVNRIRPIYYIEGRPDAVFFNTIALPGNTTQNSGSLESTAATWIPAGPSEAWYVEVLFRSNGGARLADVWSPVVHAPADCTYP
jgi:hypothetical protein